MREGVFFGAVGEKAEMTDTHETLRDHVKQEAADELFGIEGHRFQPVFVSSIPVAKSDLAVFDGEYPVSGQCHPVEPCSRHRETRVRDVSVAPSQSTTSET